MYASLPVLWVVSGMHLNMGAMAWLVHAMAMQNLERWIDSAVVTGSR